MREKHLYAKFSKEEFWLDQVAFFRHMVLVESILAYSSKIKAMLISKGQRLLKRLRVF